MDRYTQVVAVCNNIALIVSQSTDDKYIQRLAILKNLEQYWTKDLKVVLTVISGTKVHSVLNFANNADIKPRLDDVNFGDLHMESFSEEIEEKTLKKSAVKTRSNGVVKTRINVVGLATNAFIKFNDASDTVENVMTDAESIVADNMIDDDDENEDVKDCMDNAEEIYNRDELEENDDDDDDDSDVDDENDDDDVDKEEYIVSPTRKRVRNKSTPKQMSAESKPKRRTIEQMSDKLIDSKLKQTINRGSETSFASEEQSILESVKSERLNDSYEESLRTDETNDVRQDFICDTCGTPFSRQRELIRHMKDVHKIKLTTDPALGSTVNKQCPICLKIFSDPSNFRRHQRTHEPRRVSKNFICYTCTRAFSYKRTLIKHMESVHKIERTVIPPPPPSSALDNQCPICEKMFFQRSNLVRHLRIIHEMGSIRESSQSVASVKKESADDDSDKTNNLIDEKPGFEYAERFPSVAPDSVLHGHLVEVLPSPDIYTYKVMTYNTDESSMAGSFAAMFSINLDCIEEFNEWLKLFQTKNCTQFNIIHSKKLKGRRVDFKQYLKCIHNVQRGKEGKGKHTGCLARMTITLRSSVKKYVGNGSLREDSRCVVTLSWMHNHPLLATDVLRRHTVPKEVDQKLIDLFNNGHSVKSALKCMEMELDESVGNDPVEVERKRATRSILPDSKHSYYVSQKLFKNGYDAWEVYDGLEPLKNETASAVNEKTECVND